MKRRSGFVSNSSTTSFTCEVCGVAEGGMDMGAEELGFEICANGHTYCQSHAVSGERLGLEDAEAVKGYMLSVIDTLPEDAWARRWVKEIEALDPEENEDNIYDYYSDFESEVGGDVERCPICQFKELSAQDAMRYFLKRFRQSEKDLLGVFTKSFATYAKFKEWLSEK